MDDVEYRRKLMKNIQMLATLVATATYAAAFNPPGGVWQDIHDATGQHLPGDPIMRSTHHGRYVVFFYCNAAAFAFSLAVVVLTLLVTTKPKMTSLNHEKHGLFLVILMSLMLVAMLALAAAYGAGACQDKLMVVWYCLLVPGPLALFIGRTVILRVRGSGGSSTGDAQPKVDKEKEVQGKDFRKLMVPVSMFAVTITYVAGLSTPGGFWDSAEGGHRPGDAILKDRLHGKTLRGFLLSNTLAFAASLYGVSIVVRKKTSAVGPLARFIIFLVVLGLLGGLLSAYIRASIRGRSSTGWLTEAALVCIVLYVAAYVIVKKAIQTHSSSQIEGRNVSELVKVDSSGGAEPRTKRRRQAKLVQLMAGLAVAITYQAGLYPPGGLWPANADDDNMAGDPILLTTNARRYKGFYYCNSVSFVASLLAMFLAQKEFLHQHHALEAAMILDMLGLVGAYAIGSCRDQVSTLYVAGLAGAAVVYVFVHVSYFTLGDASKKEDGDNKLVEKMGDRFLLFAILVASMTYQAGLTPPGGFLLKDDAQSGHHAGDPVLRYNYPRRYRTFIYCNSVSFMVSTVLILLRINSIESGPAIRSHALSVSSAVSYICLMGAFAAGSTQHMRGSIYIFVLAAVTFFICLVIPLWVYLQRHKDDKRSLSGSSDGGSSVSNTGAAAGGAPAAPPASCSSIIEETNKVEQPSGERGEGEEGILENDDDMGGSMGEEQRKKEEEARRKEEKKKRRIKSVYLVTLAILVASATYPTGLDPPGGSWQSSSDGHDAGIPMMYDNRRPRYYAFFLSNTTSFMASIMLIHMLLPDMLLHDRTKQFHELYKTGLKALVSLQCLGFLLAYAAGSSRHFKTTLYVGALVIPVLLFVAIHVSLSACRKRAEENQRGQGGGSDDGGQQTTQQQV